MIQWIANNSLNIIVVAIVVLILMYGIMTNKVREWLKYAVTMAEKELGSGTGQLKLRKVYDWFIQMFPVFSKLLPFVLFSKLVDEALCWMKEQIESNGKIANYIYIEES